MLKNQKDIQKRLIAERERSGLTQAEFSPIIRLERSYISQLESGKKPIGEKILEKIEALEKEPLGSSGYLVTDDSTKYSTSKDSIQQLRSVLPKQIPVVSWARAGNLDSGGNFHDLADQIDEWLPSDCADPNAYALIIEGDSMLPKFENGDRIIFEPNREAQNGDVVVARLFETGQVYFKLFHRIGASNERVQLSSFNPAYPPIQYQLSEFRFIHPMHSVVRRWRR